MDSLAHWIIAILLIWLASSFISGYRGGRKSSPTKTTRARPSLSNEQIFSWPPLGDYDFEIVGESHYQDSLKKLAGEHDQGGANRQCVARLIPEDDNQYDDKAVCVEIENKVVGYLSREDARSFRRRLGTKKLTGQTTICNAMIMGGSTRNTGEVLSYGVLLDIKPFDN